MAMSNQDPQQGAAAPATPSNEPSGYRAPPPGPWGAPAAAFQAAYAPPTAMTATVAPSIYGDSAGEYLRMNRGRFSAWPHVVIAFLYQAGILGGIAGGTVALVLSLALGPHSTDIVAMAWLGVGAIVGFGGAYLSFRDRWKCIEAFSSRFCIGLLNFSILYVPVVALAYANVRAIQKLFGK
jgi:hypothetical protein